MKRSQKILVIFHLCLAFTYFFWLLLQPSLEHYAVKKSEETLFQGVFEREELFSALPNQEQLTLIEGYQTHKEAPAPSYFHALAQRLTSKTSAFALAWLFFSVLVCLLFLFHIEGATQAAWLLPLLVIGYGYTLMHRPPPPQSLFPSEDYVLENYLDEPRSDQISKTREQLKQGWHHYLVKEWAHETPSVDSQTFQAQLDRGLFAFNVKRLKNALSGEGKEDLLLPFARAPSLLLLAAYFLWNVFFAWKIRWKFAPPSALSSSGKPS